MSRPNGAQILDQLWNLWLGEGDLERHPTVLDVLDDLATLGVEGASEMYFLALKQSSDLTNKVKRTKLIASGKR